MPKLCEFENCRKQASYGYFYQTPERCKQHKEDRKLQYKICRCGNTRPYYKLADDKRASYCIKCKTDEMFSIRKGICKEYNCNTFSSFNFEGEEKGLYCSKHKKINMICVTTRKCAENKCNIRPIFNYEGEETGLYCLKHKKTNMINVKDKKCLENNCNKIPSFNFEGKSKALYCSKHKKYNMISIFVNKCYESNCNNHPSFNFIGNNKRLYCKKHAKPNMINICTLKQICKNDKCNTRATFNFEGEKKGIYCNKHKKKNMICVTTNTLKCQEDGCNTRASFNFEGKKTALYCSKHKKQNMVSMDNRKCKCGNRPFYGYKNDKKPSCCKSCMLPGMYNIVNKMCKNCVDWPDTRFANKKYKNYCARCFQRLFPTDPLTFQIKSKTKEIAVRDYINTIFDGFQHDKCLFTGGCNCPHRRRIDHRKLIGNTLLCIETDENQHKRYDKQDENDRYEDLYMVFSGKWIFIRFNPDKYTNKKGVRKNPTIARRLVKLKKEIEKQIKRIENEENKELVEISYLYYDEYD